jgi:hypothetical protein
MSFIFHNCIGHCIIKRGKNGKNGKNAVIKNRKGLTKMDVGKKINK